MAQLERILWRRMFAGCNWGHILSEQIEKNLKQLKRDYHFIAEDPLKTFICIVRDSLILSPGDAFALSHSLCDIHAPLWTRTLTPTHPTTHPPARTLSLAHTCSHTYARQLILYHLLIYIFHSSQLWSSYFLFLFLSLYCSLCCSHPFDFSTHSSLSLFLSLTHSLFLFFSVHTHSHSLPVSHSPTLFQIWKPTLKQKVGMAALSFNYFPFLSNECEEEEVCWLLQRLKLFPHSPSLLPTREMESSASFSGSCILFQETYTFCDSKRNISKSLVKIFILWQQKKITWDAEMLRNSTHQVFHTKDI